MLSNLKPRTWSIGTIAASAALALNSCATSAAVNNPSSPFEKNAQKITAELNIDGKKSPCSSQEKIQEERAKMSRRVFKCIKVHGVKDPDTGESTIKIGLSLFDDYSMIVKAYSSPPDVGGVESLTIERHVENSPEGMMASQTDVDSGVDGCLDDGLTTLQKTSAEENKEWEFNFLTTKDGAEAIGDIAERIKPYFKALEVLNEHCAQLDRAKETGCEAPADLEADAKLVAECIENYGDDVSNSSKVLTFDPEGTIISCRGETSLTREGETLHLSVSHDKTGVDLYAPVDGCILDGQAEEYIPKGQLLNYYYNEKKLDESFFRPLSPKNKNNAFREIIAPFVNFCKKLNSKK